jgi:uncharacterized damage-inducible protein DinB
MTHPMVLQLRFTRREFIRGLKGLSEEDAQRRLLPMNSLSWNVGHLAWHEQRYFLMFAQGIELYPDINRQFAYGAPASTPALAEMLAAWEAVTAAADPWLDRLTTASLQELVGPKKNRIYGNLLQRVIYHYWYHNGENQAIRQQLGHGGLEEFVGNIDEEGSYQPE